MLIDPSNKPSRKQLLVGALLTSRDLEIFDALTKRVRVLSLSQIARTWWSDSENASKVAENRLRLLTDQNLLKIERLPAHPEIELEAPVATWAPDRQEPNLGAISYQLQSRWHLHPMLTPCVSASKKAVDRFGGYGGRPPRSVERTHDLHMAQIFLRYRLLHPALVANWVFEEKVRVERRLQRAAPKYGEKLPDVVLRSTTDERVIEFGGAYSKEKLLAFHGYCKERSLAYEIW